MSTLAPPIPITSKERAVDATFPIPTKFRAVLFCKALSLKQQRVVSEPVIIDVPEIPATEQSKLAYARMQMPAIEKAEAEMWDNGKYSGVKFPGVVQPDTIAQRTILVPLGQNVDEVIERHL